MERNQTNAALTRRRKRAGRSRAQIAALIPVSRATLLRWERGDGDLPEYKRLAWIRAVEAAEAEAMEKGRYDN